MYINLVNRVFSCELKLRWVWCLHYYISCYLFYFLFLYYLVFWTCFLVCWSSLLAFTEDAILFSVSMQMHVLNKMQEYGKNNPVTADFVKDVAFGSASIRHFLQKINTQTCNTCRYVLIPLHSNWHWHLLSIDLKERRFESWNSLWSHSGAQDAAQLLVLFYSSQ